LLGKYLTKLSIQQRIFIASILPAIILGIMMSTYYIANWINENNEALQIKGARYSTDLSKLSEFSIFSENIQFLNMLSKSLFNDPDVYSVRILDKDKNPLVSNVSPRYKSVSYKNSDELIFMVIVGGSQLTTIFSDDFENQIAINDTPHADYLGWTEVKMTKLDILKKQGQLIGKLFLIIAIVIFSTLILSYVVSKMITKPIVNMKRSIDNLADGITIDNKNNYPENELGDLEKAFHDMAVTVNLSKYELQKRIDIATARSQETIIKLKNKNRELNIIKEEVTNANNAKTLFLAKMSHEIRTPLQSIIGYFNLINELTVSAKQKEYLSVIDSASQHLLLLIDNLLEISNIENNPHVMPLIDFNLRNSIEDVIQILGPLANNKNIEMIMLVESEIEINVLSVEYYLKQILINLIGNAIKFTKPEGEVVIRLILKENNPDSVRTLISIADTGIGIDPKKIQEIQQPFYQASNDHTVSFGGIGLGLSIVNKLLESLRGTLTIQSSPGIGSIFTVDLVLNKQSNTAMIVTDDCFNGLKVLCYDHNTLSLKALKNQLLYASEKVFAVRNVSTIYNTISKHEENNAFNLIIFSIDKKLQRSKLFVRLLEKILLNTNCQILIASSCQDSIESDIITRFPGRIITISKPVTHNYLRNTIKSHMSELLIRDSISNPTEPNKCSSSDRSVDSNNAAFRVLLAEDNDFNRHYIGTLLRERGFIVSEASTGPAALDAALKYTFDLILMDIHLPISDGIAVTNQIRSQSGPVSMTPIIALTADVYIQEKPEFKQSTFNAIVTKPIIEAKLWAVCNDLLHIGNMGPGSNLDPIKRNLLPKLIKELPAHEKRIKKSFNAADYTQLSLDLHQLKGICDYLHLDILTTSTSNAERYIRETKVLSDNTIESLVKKVLKDINEIARTY